MGRPAPHIFAADIRDQAVTVDGQPVAFLHCALFHRLADLADKSGVLHLHHGTTDAEVLDAVADGLRRALDHAEEVDLTDDGCPSHTPYRASVNVLTHEGVAAVLIHLSALADGALIAVDPDAIDAELERTH